MKREGGYTVVETGLAIAVSASMVLLTFGLSIMVSRQRFRDTMTTAQAFVQAQYNEVRAGINSRLGGSTAGTLGCTDDGSSAATANSNGCYIIGRYVTFENNGSEDGRIRSSYIVAKASGTWPVQEKTALANLTDGSATLYALTRENNDAGLNPTVKQLGYGSSIGKQWFVNGSSASAISTASIAIMRSPLDGSLVIASGVTTQTDTSGRTKLNFGSAKTNMTSSQRLAVAIVNGNLGYKGGLICIPGGDSSAGISNNFNADLKWDNLNDASNNSKVVEGCRNWE